MLKFKEILGYISWSSSGVDREREWTSVKKTSGNGITSKRMHTISTNEGLNYY